MIEITRMSAQRCIKNEAGGMDFPPPSAAYDPKASSSKPGTLTIMTPEFELISYGGRSRGLVLLPLRFHKISNLSKKAAP